MRQECHLVLLGLALLDASVGASILEGLDEMSTAPRLAPFGACTNGTTHLVAS